MEKTWLCANNMLHTRYYHVQHALCHVVWRDSLATNFDKTEITFIFSCFISLDETISPERKGGNPWWQTPKMQDIKPHKFKPRPRLEPAFQHWPGKLTCYPLHHALPQFHYAQSQKYPLCAQSSLLQISPSHREERLLLVLFSQQEPIPVFNHFTTEC